MNERIKELMVRLVPDAFMTYKGYLYHSSDPKVFEHSDPEPLYTKQELVKFAELIVRECVQSLDRNVVYEILCSDEIPTKDNHWEGFVSEKIITDVANQIKKHFGVEE